MLELDALDRKLIVQLDLNGRQSYAELSRKLKHGSDLIRYRVQRLEERNILGFVSAVVDLQKLGLDVYKVYLKLAGNGRQELIKYLDKSPSTYWLAEYYGSYDLQVSIASPSAANFLRIYDNIWQRFAAVIKESHVCNTVLVQRYPKNYLGPGSRKHTAQGDSSKTYEASELELKILSELFEDARISNVELAEKLNTTTTVVSYWIDKLEKAGVILGYRMQVNYQQLDAMLFKLLITLERQDTLFLESFENYCKRTANVTCYVRQIGNWPIECEIEVPNYSDLHKFTEQIETNFSENIRGIGYLVMRTDYYHRFPVVETTTAA